LGSIAERKDAAHIRRSYRMMFAAAVCLAAIGAPLLMQGAVVLVMGIASPHSSTFSPVQAIMLFGLSALPMALAWLAWRRAQGYQAELGE
jgi:hypothetical protein